MLGGLSAVVQCSIFLLFALNLPLLAPLVFILPLANQPSDVNALFTTQVQIQQAGC